jgi:cystathionine beta-lyase/cystathionine gamma-synthase
MSEEGFLQQQLGFATKAIHVGQEPEQWSSNAVVPPISLSTTFKQEAPAKHKVSIAANRYCFSIETVIAYHITIDMRMEILTVVLLNV